MLGAEQFEFKEFTSFYAPFDIRGTAFIIYPYADPFREEDGSPYIPNLWRVRRISAEAKSDLLLATDKRYSNRGLGFLDLIKFVCNAFR